MSSGKLRPSCLGLNVLTHWGLSQIDVLEMTFSNANSWMKMIVQNFIGVCSLEPNLKYISIGSGGGRADDKPLPEPLMNQSNAMYMYHGVSVI